VRETEVQREGFSLEVGAGLSGLNSKPLSTQAWSRGGSKHTPFSVPYSRLFWIHHHPSLSERFSRLSLRFRVYQFELRSYGQITFSPGIFDLVVKVQVGE